MMNITRKYYNFGTNYKNFEDRCHEYIGMDNYSVNGTVIGSSKCKRCHKFKSCGIDENKIHYVECEV